MRPGRLAIGALALLCTASAPAAASEGVPIVPVHPGMIAPFALLLLSIAVVPFINRHFWEKSYPAFAGVLGAVTLVYYLFFIHNAPRVLLTAHEYFSFIVLIGSLFVVAGGIHIRISGTATPGENVLSLLLGAVLSNVLGTTGASMVLIRPYIRANRARIKPYHVIFFIFIVSNIGGALTPIGDPPLFLGYLKGIPFFWIIGRVSHIWLLALLAVIGVFYVIDRLHFRKAPAEVRVRARRSREDFEFTGMHNLIFLSAIIGAVFIQHPLYLREAIMIAASVASYMTTKPSIHHQNEFNFTPIKEVAILFAGIFASMIPALDWLELNGDALGLRTPAHFYWLTGSLSAVLDNAPTYLTFLSAAFGLHNLSVDDPHQMSLFLTQHPHFVLAISIAAVFFGAMTYIGNGPNFMVKSIAEQSRIHCPTFFGYVIKYSVPVLLPIFLAVALIFFRT
ncbi:MAG: sodium:proton antiporter [Acidobacteria bacterium]|nr:sodium:proton antiporter [Acidobacteriota bacterium]